jgi:hypothetical protein
MNIYLCSTVRNLLFSLVKSLDESDVKCSILMICDQQNICVDDYDLSVLPDHIRVSFITRKGIRDRLDSSLEGVLLRGLAALKVRTSRRFRLRISTLLFDDIRRHLRHGCKPMGRQDLPYKRAKESL